MPLGVAGVARRGSSSKSFLSISARRRSMSSTGDDVIVWFIVVVIGGAAVANEFNRFNGSSWTICREASRREVRGVCSSIGFSKIFSSISGLKHRVDESINSSGFSGSLTFSTAKN